MTISWAVAGTGGIAARFARALTQVPDARLVAVASRTERAGAAFAAEHGIPAHHVGLEPLLSDPSVDVVYLASPHSEHLPQALLALAAGKHVLVEKPMALSAGQVARMVELAAARGSFLMEAMWSRFLPSYVRLRELVGEGAIGDVRSVQADVGFVAPFVPEHRIYRPELGGGVLLDVGTYPVQLALMLLGRPDTVTATATLGPTGVDHDDVVTLGWDEGRTAAVRCSLIADLSGAARVVGSLGSIELAAPHLATESLTVVRPGEADEVLALPVVGDGLRYEVEEVHRCVRAGELQSAVMSWDDSLALASTLDRVRDAIGLRFPGE